MKQRFKLSNKEQSGSVLVISLVILSVITITSIVAIQRSTMQLKMVGSMQRGQAVFNSTFDYLTEGQEQMNLALSNGGADVRGMLSRLIDDSNLSVDVFSQFNWQEPSASKEVGGVSGTLSISDFDNYSAADINPNHLKSREGGNSEITYFFTFAATGQDRSGNITSSQEFGLTFKAPAPSAN